MTLAKTVEWEVCTLRVLDARIVRAIACTIAYIPVIFRMSTGDYNHATLHAFLSLEIISCAYFIIQIWRSYAASPVLHSVISKRIQALIGLLSIPCLSHVLCTCTIAYLGPREAVEMMILVTWMDVYSWGLFHVPLEPRVLLELVTTKCPGMRLLGLSNDRSFLEQIPFEEDADESGSNRPTDPMVASYQRSLLSGGIFISTTDYWESSEA